MNNWEKLKDAIDNNKFKKVKKMLNALNINQLNDRSNTFFMRIMNQSRYHIYMINHEFNDDYSNFNPEDMQKHEKRIRKYEYKTRIFLIYLLKKGVYMNIPYDYVYTIANSPEPTKLLNYHCKLNSELFIRNKSINDETLIIVEISLLPYLRFSCFDLYLQSLI